MILSKTKWLAFPDSIHGNESGYISILVASLCLIATLTIPISVTVAGALITSKRLQNAADLAALAGAVFVYRDESKVCDVADEVSMANGSRIESCKVKDGVVEVIVRADVAGATLIDKFITLRAKARAGLTELPP